MRDEEPKLADVKLEGSFKPDDTFALEELRLGDDPREEPDGENPKLARELIILVEEISELLVVITFDNEVEISMPVAVCLSLLTRAELPDDDAKLSISADVTDTSEAPDWELKLLPVPREDLGVVKNKIVVLEDPPDLV